MAGFLNESRRDGLFDATFCRYPAALAAIVMTALIFAPSMTARAGDMTVANAAVTGTPSILDGKVFSGEFGALGKTTINHDTWVFENGTFMSKQCVKCGFPRGVYQTRRDGDKIAFVTETPCPRTDARIVWRGTIENGRIEGIYTWTKKRWYRTIRKKFWFKGTLSGNKQAAAGN